MKVLSLLAILALTINTAGADEPKTRNPDCLTMPCELVTFAQGMGMKPISTDFYALADEGAIHGAPFVFGTFYPFEMAAFWATKSVGGKTETYLAVLKRKFGSVHKWQLCKECSSPIPVRNETVGGLWFDAEASSPISNSGKGIYFNTGKKLKVLNVYRVKDKERAYVKKQNVTLMVPPIVSMEDGVVSTFYCIDGEWWAANSD